MGFGHGAIDDGAGVAVSMEAANLIKSISARSARPRDRVDE
jgi:Zn-dependent M28 family amino/carboxypeptidase